jgi:hypothetical protein
MRKTFIIFLSSILIQGCSQLLWIKYLEPDTPGQWQASGVMFPQRRSVQFGQPCYAYRESSFTVRVCPELLSDFLISLGPPYIPIVPFVPQYLFSPERPFVLELSIADSSNNSMFDPRQVAVRLDSTRFLSPTEIRIERIDSLRRIHWEAISPSPLDTSVGFIPISSFRTRVRCVFDIFPSEFDSLAISVRRLTRTSGSTLPIPELRLVRKGRLLYESMSAA